MTANIVILDPSAPQLPATESEPWQLEGLRGKVVGFIDNAKPNFNHLVDELAQLLVAHHGVARVLKERKRAASVPADKATLDAVAAQCDLVITGSGD
ncbi:MAG: hypothetical protein EHM59_10925 [Betaproteobacteria bacterium]|nr:MAG: hypothetical protein EHM59_10925 [Betaproteobacteria bacterium]